MPVGKAVWYIEGNLGNELRLDDVARSVGLSRFHLARVFGSATGYSIMGYVRARRLSEAARRLAAGSVEILPVALSFGYGSHEAFTRAFRDQFGVTPEAVRAKGTLETLELTEPITMTQVNTKPIEPVRFLDAPAMRFAGQGRRYRFSEIRELPRLWAEFGAHLGHIPGAIEGAAWGISYDTVLDGDGFDYLAAVEVTPGTSIPGDFKTYDCPALRYAIFEHAGHVSEMNRTMQGVMGWMQTPGVVHAEPGVILERYGREFDVMKGVGGMEVWVPVKL